MAEGRTDEQTDRRMEAFTISPSQKCGDKSTVDYHYFEVQGTLLNTLRYPYLDISDLQN